MTSQIPEAILTYLQPFIERIEILEKRCAYLEQEMTKKNSSKSNHPSATKIPSGNTIPVSTPQVTKKIQHSTTKTTKTETTSKTIEPKIDDHKMEVSTKNQITNPDMKNHNTTKKEEAQPRLSAQSGKATPMTKQRTISKTTSTKQLKKQEPKKVPGPTTPTVNNKKGSALTTEKKGFSSAKKAQKVQEKKENPLENVPQATEKMEEDKSAQKEKVQSKVQPSTSSQPLVITEETVKTQTVQQEKKTEHSKQPTKMQAKQNTTKSRTSLTDAHKAATKKTQEKTNMKGSTLKTDMKSSKVPANTKTNNTKENKKSTGTNEESKTHRPTNNENENTLNMATQVKEDQILKEKVQVIEKEQDNLMCDEVLEMKQESLV